ncbi:VCBS domain-containing protein, partial [Vibrio vulnificus]
VLGTNDAATVGQGQDDVDSGSVKEDTAAQSVAAGKLTVTDGDEGEAELKPQTVANDYGTFELKADGSWSFTIDNTKPAVQALSEGEEVSLSFPVESKDGTGSATVDIKVLGTNDAATVGQGQDDVDSGSVKEDTAAQSVAA